ncbi:DNA methyltransferase [Vagococcus vulneris]|uniref:DNA methylase N-4/N-6 domain-containing protein n=1 Tax=Vagococcus vulneris TaxID=1977869 RepID=A0A430A1F4_9ENTE|nr:site-specific DNA-methyltransferase [Vagococcus vulneris]RSU00228.1 hypothetical protein CBF37_02725 [Vagococcus vulneris]
MENLEITKLDELDGFSTVFSSFQKKQLQDYYKKQLKLNKNSTELLTTEIQVEYADLTRSLRKVRSAMFKYIEIEYGICNDLKQDIYRDRTEHIQRLDEIIGMSFEDFSHDFMEEIELEYIWYDRCSQKDLNSQQKREYLENKNESKRKKEIKRYEAEGFLETVKLFNFVGNNNFILQTLINYYEQIYKFIFETRPYLYRDYDYMKSIPFDEESEILWFNGKGSLEDMQRYEATLPLELDTYLMEHIQEQSSSTKNIPNVGEQNLIVNCDFETLHKSLPNNSIDIVLTDPPYFINYAGNKWDEGMNETDRLQFFVNYFKTLIPKLKPEAVLLIFNDFSNITIIQEALQIAYSEVYYEDLNKEFLEDSKEDWLKTLREDKEFTILPYLEWVKTNPRPSAHYNKHSEYIVTAIKGFKNFFNVDGLYEHQAMKKFKNNNDFIKNLDKNSLEYENLLEQLDLANLANIENSLDESSEIYNNLFSNNAYFTKDIIHDTPKPAVMLNTLLKRFSTPGMTVLDSFSGSGAITIAAYELGLNSFACERDDYMTLLSKNRFADFSKFIGKKTINLMIKNPKDYLLSYYTYELLKKDIVNNFYIPMNRLNNKKERMKLLEVRLIEIKRKAWKKGLVGLIDNKLNYEDHCFLLGFNELYNTSDFYTFFGESGRNKSLLFEDNDEKRHSVNLACRYFNKFKQTLYAGDFITYLYDCSFAFKNWKNLGNEERHIRLEKYVRYLYHLITDLILLDSTMLKQIESIKVINKDDSSYKCVYHYYFTLTLATRYYYRLILELEKDEKNGFSSDEKFKKYRFTSNEINDSSPLISISSIAEFKEYNNYLYKDYEYQKNSSDIKIKPSLDAIEYFLDNIKTKHINEERLNSIYVAKNIGLTKGILNRKKIKSDGNLEGTGKNLISLQPYMYIKDNDRKKLIKEIKKEKVKVYKKYEEIRK